MLRIDSSVYAELNCSCGFFKKISIFMYLNKILCSLMTIYRVPCVHLPYSLCEIKDILILILYPLQFCTVFCI